MRKRELAAWVLALFMVVGLAPAAATHVTEPSRPITGLTLRLHKYPDLTTTVDCSTGTAIYSFPSMRIEAFVIADQTWADRQAPSEHYTVRVEAFGQRPDGLNRRLWDSQWRHQNNPPHPLAQQRGFEVTQSNTYGMIDGPGRVKVTVTGHESGTILTTECLFVVDVP